MVLDGCVLSECACQAAGGVAQLACVGGAVLLASEVGSGDRLVGRVVTLHTGGWPLGESPS